LKKEGNYQKIELPFYKILLGNQPSDLLNMNTQTETEQTETEQTETEQTETEQTETEQTENEQFYCEPSCECNTKMDIRLRCDPVKSAPSFENCPAKVDTVYYYLNNNFLDYKKYEHLCEPGVRADRNDIIIGIAYDKYDLDHNDLDELLELFDEADEESRKYECICCDDFVFAYDEDKCRFDGDEEGLICWNCIPEHFCEDCDEYYATVIEPNICGKYICYRCEEDRLDAFKEAEQKKKLNKAIKQRWELVKKDMENWVEDYTTDDIYSIVEREGLIKSLNVMLNELGQQVGDEYDN